MGLLDLMAVLLLSLLSPDLSLLTLQKTYGDPVCDLGHAISLSIQNMGLFLSFLCCVNSLNPESDVSERIIYNF